MSDPAAGSVKVAGEAPVSEPAALRRTLSPLLLWGLGVGYVISGMYFGWNLGLEKGGTLGLAGASLFVVILYITFSLGYCELACAIPRAGGAFDYVNRALGRNWGFIAGLAQSIEFILAPPAIAYAIGAYFNLSFPQLPVLLVAVVAYLTFTCLNVCGLRAAALFELIVTVLAVAELLLFAGIALPHFTLSHLLANGFPHGWEGALAAVPFAIWFFLGIEGVANVAEEVVDPQRTIALGFGSAILTLVLLSILTFCAAVGVAGWEAIVYHGDGSLSDSPLPLALGQIIDASTMLYHSLIMVGLLGLVASFHGLLLVAGRSSYELGRVGYVPAFIGRVHARFRTPANALLLNMCFGIIALLTGRTAEVITLSVFGALTLYVLSMLALIRLRRIEPDLERPFKVPLYPFFPAIALTLAGFFLTVMVVYNPLLAFVYGLLLGSAFLAFKVCK